MKYLTILFLIMHFGVIQAEDRGQIGPAPVGTSFSYQGLLELDGQTVNGNYDFEITLYDEPVNGSAIVAPLTINDIPVKDGVFTLSLDFGDAVFMGDARYLGFLVRESGTTTYYILEQRQRIHNVPYAIQSSFTEDAVSLWEDQAGGLTYNGGNVSIGGNATGSSRLQVQAPNGTSPLRVRLDGVGTKLRVHGNGGTSLGVNATPPENGLYVLGEVSQPLSQHGFAKAGLRFVCGNQGTTIFESFNNVNDDDIVVTSNLPEAGRCEISFPFDIDESYVIANPFATNIIRGVSCGKTTSGGNDIIECNGYNPLSAARADVVMTLLLF
ncbi:hypothetical protein [Marinicella sp. W31]|uniref:hypothetical protein n=1 Tax=Marinicella sp. W31 TaxID=3023713 RepID=UPI0037564C06